MALSFSSLRVRLLLLVLLAVLPALGLTLYTDSERRRLEAGQMQEDALRVAHLASFTEAQLIEGTRHLLVVLASLPEVRAGDPAACSALFADLLKQYPRYANFLVISPDGNAFCSALPASGSVYVGDRTYFQRAVQTRDFAIGEYQIGRITGRATVNFGYPVGEAAGPVQGVVVAALDLAWLNRLAAEVQLPPQATLTVVDRSGTILVRHPDQGRWSGKSAAAAPIFGAFLAGESADTAEGPDLDGVTRLFAFSRLGGGARGADVFAGIGFPREPLAAAANRALARNLALLGLVGVLALAAAWVGGDLFILRRVTALVRTTKRLSAGDLSARTGIPYGPAGGGELSHLARSFDHMAESLEQAEQQRLAQEALRRKHLALEADLARAAQVQAGLLPLDIPALPGFELAARCVPAREVGGDFYDWEAPAPGTLTLTLGDVSGKGMPAALLMATARAALRALARQSQPAATVRAAAAALEVDLQRSRSFVTLFHAQLDLAARRLQYVDAGHGLVFVRRAGGAVEQLPLRGLPIGVLPEATYQQGSLDFAPGDTLVVYSDGLPDALPELTITPAVLGERLLGAAGAREMVDRLVSLPALIGAPPDDLTVVVLRCVEPLRSGGASDPAATTAPGVWPEGASPPS